MAVRAIAFSVVAAIVLAIEALNFTGFCYRDARYLSDQALLESAARTIFPRDRPQDSAGKEYSSIAELLADNPNCCKVHRGAYLFEWTGKIAPVWMRLFGYFRAEAELHYRVPVGSGAPSEGYERYVYVSSCGDVVGQNGVSLGP